MAPDLLNQPLELPCGTVISNRIAKSAMSETMADMNHGPSGSLIRLYELWGRSGASILFTGNVMVDRNALGESHNVVIEDERHLVKLSEWAAAAKKSGSQIWMQINHPGRQAPALINKEVFGPSAVGLKQKVVFKTPTPLTGTQIRDIITRFGNVASIAQKAGFDGVQIHGAHGYLVSQFLSPLTNKRTDEWGGSLENRARFVLEIYREMRQRTGSKFPIGIKINSADFQRGGFSEEESMDVIDLLSNEGIDLIEVSGGTYEKAAMMGATAKKSTREREAYFMDYIVKVRKRTNKPLMLTGGFRSVTAMEMALRNNELDIIGMARPFVLYPMLARQIFDHELNVAHVPDIRTNVEMIDKLGFLDTTWYSAQIERLGAGRNPDPDLSPWAAVWKVGKSLVLRM